MDRSLYYFLGINPAPLDLLGSLSYIIDICEGLRYLHRSGVLHRDIKSHNILLYEGGAKLSDFGLAHICTTIGQTTGNANVTNNMAGTKFWMAPEVLVNGDNSFASDIFSLHVVLWEIIENKQGGVGEPIGTRLRLEPTAKLPLTGEGAEDHPTRLRLHQLVRACGLADTKRRWKIGDVLAEAKSIYDSLGQSGATASTGSPWRGLQVEEDGLRPSEARRQAQGSEASAGKRGAWENWKTFDSSRVAMDIQDTQVRKGGDPTPAPDVKYKARGDGGATRAPAFEGPGDGGETPAPDSEGTTSASAEQRNTEERKRFADEAKRRADEAEARRRAVEEQLTRPPEEVLEAQPHDVNAKQKANERLGDDVEAQRPTEHAETKSDEAEAVPVVNERAQVDNYDDFCVCTCPVFTAFFVAFLVVYVLDTDNDTAWEVCLISSIVVFLTSLGDSRLSALVCCMSLVAFLVLVISETDKSLAWAFCLVVVIVSCGNVLGLWKDCMIVEVSTQWREFWTGYFRT
ncbi:unnamed protein product [Pylaiella littoralis]